MVCVYVCVLRTLREAVSNFILILIAFVVAVYTLVYVYYVL